LSAWGTGRVTLLGDAAHPMTPNLGQGACQAIEDAVVLARAMTGTADVAAAFRGYEAARMPRTRAIVTSSRQMGAMAQWSNPAAIRLRNTLMALLAPRLMVKRMGQVIGYRA